MKISKHNSASFIKLKLDDLKPIIGFFQLTKFSSRTILLEQGSLCQSAWFIDKGILRAYYYQEERKRTSISEVDETIIREMTSWIVPEGGFLTDNKSFLLQAPSSYYIETLEPCILYTLSYDNYLMIQRLYPEISVKLFEQTIVMADTRLQICNLRNPEDRLEMFELIYPTIAGRLSINVQASYLNIDPTTLSRIRGRLKKKY